MIDLATADAHIGATVTGLNDRGDRWYGSIAGVAAGRIMVRLAGADKLIPVRPVAAEPHGWVA